MDPAVSVASFWAFGVGGYFFVVGLWRAGSATSTPTVVDIVGLVICYMVTVANEWSRQEALLSRADQVICLVLSGLVWIILLLGSCHSKPDKEASAC